MAEKELGAETVEKINKLAASYKANNLVATMEEAVAKAEQVILDSPDKSAEEFEKDMDKAEKDIKDIEE